MMVAGQSSRLYGTRAEICRAFGRTLRDLRYRANLSQEWIALEVGIDRSYMSALERAKHVPSLDIICKLLPILGIGFVDFAVQFDYTLRGFRTPDGGGSRRRRA